MLIIEKGSGLFCTRRWTFWFYKMRGVSWLAEDLSASQEGLCSMESVYRDVVCFALKKVRAWRRVFGFLAWEVITRPAATFVLRLGPTEPHTQVCTAIRAHRASHPSAYCDYGPPSLTPKCVLRLGSTEPHTQVRTAFRAHRASHAIGYFSTSAKRSAHESGRSTSCRSQVRRAWSCTSSHARWLHR